MRLKNSSWYLIFFFLSLALFSWLQADPTFSDPDSFYHARIIQLIKDQGLIQNFPWLTQTVLSDNFTDHHLLYHLLLVPLLIFFEPWLAVKNGAIILSALFILSLAFYLRKQQIKYAWVYLLLLLTNGPFLVRLSLPKATPLALILLFLGLYFIEKKKYLFLFLVSFLYVWAHAGFLLLLIVAVIFYIIEIIFNKLKHVETQNFASLRAILIVISGTMAGLVINPYFPKNLLFYWQQVIQIGLINYKDKIEVGAEWYAYKIQDLIGATSLVWILVFGALLVFIIYIKHQKQQHVQWLALVIFFLLATIRSRRFVEYFIPISIIWTSLVLTWFLNTRFFQEQLSKFKASYKRKRISWNILFIYLAIVVPFGMGNILLSLKRELASGFSIDTFSGASQYLKTHTKAGDIVFHAKWDDWPILFYHNPDNYYLVGLDPTFMYKKNKKLYNLWRDIGEGKIKKDLGQAIKDDFNSRYVFLDKEEKDTELFQTYLERDKKIQIIFDDDRTRLYEIK